MRGDDISEDQKKLYRENVNKIDLVLNEEGNKVIAEEYLRIERKKQNTKTGKAGKVSYWYELFDGPTSVEAISIYLNETALYQFIYRNCSSYAHIEDIVHTNFEPHDELSFKFSSLRDLRQLSAVANGVLLLIERSIILFVKSKAGDKKEFAEKLLPLMEEKRMFSERLKLEQ